MPRPRLTVLFAGMIAADPHQGGATWAVLQYVLGLQRLGHEVVFVEPVAPPKNGRDDWRLATSESAEYFQQVIAEFGLEQSAALVLAGSKECVGLSYEEVRAAAKGADILFNVSGMLTDPALIEMIPRRVYLDLDPAFIQLWQSEYQIDMR